MGLALGDAPAVGSLVSCSDSIVNACSSAIVRRTGDEGLSVAVEAAGGVADAESVTNAFSNAQGRLLPRADARRRMPLAARADSENLGGALGCKMSVSVVGIAAQAKDEDASSPLGHSEVASVEHPVRHAIPEFDQATEERRHVSPAMTGEEARYVLEEDGGRSVSFHKVEEGVGETGSCISTVHVRSHAASLAGDGEVLAGETAGPEGCIGPISTAFVLICWPCQPWPKPRNVAATSLPFISVDLDGVSGDVGDVSEVGDVGPSLREDRAGVGVDLGEADGAPSGSLQAEVCPADA
jgi:hypothetical protein